MLGNRVLALCAILWEQCGRVELISYHLSFVADLLSTIYR